MGIGTDLVEFFSVIKAPPRQPILRLYALSLDDFLHQHSAYVGRLNEVWIACHRLAGRGYLASVSALETSDVLSPFHTRYAAQDFNEDLASYGVYDFIAMGFPYIRQYFIKSVLPVFVLTKEGKEENGTGFLLENRKIVTAAHCVKNMKKVQIPDWHHDAVPLKNIWVHEDERVDLAILEFDGDPFPGVPGFQIQEGQVLDDILTMGYPPISGYFPVLIAETAQVAGYLHATTGKIVGSEKCYLDQQTHLLISARIKGGSSGGPVINHEGKVVGVVVQLPSDDKGVDTLGYGAAIPITTLKDFLQDCTNQFEHMQRLKFDAAGDSFTTAR